jgi:hypothetical protein
MSLSAEQLQRKVILAAYDLFLKFQKTPDHSTRGTPLLPTIGWAVLRYSTLTPLEVHRIGDRLIIDIPVASAFYPSNAWRFNVPPNVWILFCPDLMARKCYSILCPTPAYRFNLLTDTATAWAVLSIFEKRQTPYYLTYDLRLPRRLRGWAAF